MTIEEVAKDTKYKTQKPLEYNSSESAKEEMLHFSDLKCEEQFHKSSLSIINSFDMCPMNKVYETSIEPDLDTIPNNWRCNHEISISHRSGSMRKLLTLAGAVNSRLLRQREDCEDTLDMKSTDDPSEAASVAEEEEDYEEDEHEDAPLMVNSEEGDVVENLNQNSENNMRSYIDKDETEREPYESLSSNARK